MSPSSPPERTLTRRAAVGAIGVLGAGAALVSVGGCDLRDLTHAVGDNRPDPGAVADRAALAGALALTRAAIARLEETTTHYPGVAARLADVLAMHRAHLAVLARATPSTPSASPGPSSSATAPPPVAATAGAAVAALADLERRTRLRLTGLAQSAHSGELARILASMAAAISQRLARWPA